MRARTTTSSRNPRRSWHTARPIVAKFTTLFLATSAFRFYEDKALTGSIRTAGNQRCCTRDVTRRVSFIQAAKRVGLSLDEIRAVLDDLPAGRTPTREDWHELARRWKPWLDVGVYSRPAYRHFLNRVPTHSPVFPKASPASSTTSPAPSSTRSVVMPTPLADISESLPSPSTFSSSPSITFPTPLSPGICPALSGRNRCSVSSFSLYPSFISPDET